MRIGYQLRIVYIYFRIEEQTYNIPYENRMKTSVYFIDKECYSVLEHKETPGLGSKMGEWFVKGAKGDVTGKTPGTAGLQVSKDGGDVDAITAATISSRAFLDAINRASKALAEKQK